MVRILFVCMGNICRSPMAEGVLRKLLAEEQLEHRVHVDSAGTHDYHTGSAPDPRARRAAMNRGIDLTDLVARTVREEDFSTFDHVLAMDLDNLKGLQDRCPEDGLRSRIALTMTFSDENKQAEVPDPYYGGSQGFERVLDMLEQASAGLLEHIRRTHGL